MPSTAQIGRFSIRDQWDLAFDRTSVAELPSRTGAGGSYSQLGACVRCSRIPVFHLANTMFLMFSIVLVSLGCALVIPAPAIGDRLSLTAGLLLTAVALKLLASDKLPDLPYMTLLDK